MEDGNYDSEYPKDMELMKLQWDKYMMRWSVTDPMLELYNNVARILQKQYPSSGGKLGFLAYANMTIPPVRPMKAEKSLFCELAPIDIDPIHGMDDEDSPPRQEYRDMMYKWAKVMEGRLAIYDYDQGMLVWRDIPNPSHQALKQDFTHYAKAGILGVNTESRNAIGTTFLNLFFRGRLMWNPDEDVDGSRGVLSQVLRAGGRADGDLLERHLQGVGRHDRHRARVLRRPGHLHAGGDRNLPQEPGRGREAGGAAGDKANAAATNSRSWTA